MTEPIRPRHEPWDELVAGYALDALEPEDEASLLEHLPGCARCRADLDEFSLVASQLGSLADDDAEAPSWQQIRAHVVTDSSTVVDLGRQRAQRRAPRVLAAAAAVVLLASGGVLTWHFTTRSSGTSSTTALAACASRPGCSVVRLHAAGGDVAAVVVEQGSARLVPLHLAQPAAARIYALWQLPRDGSPIFLNTFRDTNRQTGAQPLVVSYADTAAFAISLEPAGIRPQRPSTVIAVGAAPA